MKLNSSKTKMIVFNPTEIRQCVPFVSLLDGEPLQCVDEMRLLGMLFDDKLSWWPLVADIKRRTSTKIWSLVKLRDAGASPVHLAQVCTARIKSTVEYGAQVYGCCLSKGQSNEIESIQYPGATEPTLTQLASPD